MTSKQAHNLILATFVIAAMIELVILPLMKVILSGHATVILH